MARTGPNSKLKKVEQAIQEMLLSNSQTRLHGMGFREIHRNLQNKPKTSSARSFSTLYKCLRHLEANQIIRKSTVTKKYHFDEIGFAHYDKDLVMEAISESNVLGGGRLLKPHIEILGDRIIIPEEKPEVFVAVDTFVRANIKGIWGWRDQGVQFIETFEGQWHENHHEANGNANATSRIGREPLHFERLVIRRLNAKKIAGDWVKAIWDYARKNKIVDCDLTLDKASNEDLERVWKAIFLSARVETVVLTEFIKPQKLLEWWTESKRPVQSK